MYPLVIFFVFDDSERFRDTSWLSLRGFPLCPLLSLPRTAGPLLPRSFVVPSHALTQGIPFGPGLTSSETAHRGKGKSHHFQGQASGFFPICSLTGACRCLAWIVRILAVWVDSMHWPTQSFMVYKHTTIIE